jgi:hypothetical protein
MFQPLFRKSMKDILRPKATVGSSELAQSVSLSHVPNRLPQVRRDRCQMRIGNHHKMTIGSIGQFDRLPSLAAGTIERQFTGAHQL